MGLLDRVNNANAARLGAPPVPPLSPPPAAPGREMNGRLGVETPPVLPVAPTAPPPAIATPEPPAGERPAVAQPAGWTAAKTAVHAKLLEQYASKIDVTDSAFVREKVVELTDEHVRNTGMALTRPDRERLIESLMQDILGLGPMQGLLDDNDISEVMVNHPKQVFIERSGKLMLSSVVFESDRQLMKVIDKIVVGAGRRVDESQPICDCRLPNGSRVNVIIPPLALKGPCITIRKFKKDKLGPDDLLHYRSATPQIIDFLRAAVRSRLNVLVSGGTGSGKTTLLNILSSFIPSDERLITCEDAAELQLQQEHVITLQSRPPNVEGRGAVTIRDLVANCLRMRPERIIVGECRGGEALDMLQAMNTGHDGSMSTLHANNPHEALGRLETLVLQAGVDLPSRAIREQMASAVHIIVQQQRLQGGPRKITAIAEVLGIEGTEIKFQVLYEFRQVRVREGKAVGYHTATGLKPKRLDTMRARGEDISDDLFEPTSEPADEDLY